MKSVPAAAHIGRTKLDQERLKLCNYEIVSMVFWGTLIMSPFFPRVPEHIFCPVYVSKYVYEFLEINVIYLRSLLGSGDASGFGTEKHM